VKASLEGRRVGFALRPPLAGVALGIGLAVTILDLMAWFGWGARLTNGLVVASVWLCGAAAVVGLLGLATGFAEYLDAPDDDRSLARLDAIGVAVATVVYVASGVLRALDSGAAAASPAAFLLALVALIVLSAGAAMSALLYASREWEEIEEVTHVPHRRRRTAS
jgi:uncharacterized membrane protein